MRNADETEKLEVNITNLFRLRVSFSLAAVVLCWTLPGALAQAYTPPPPPLTTAPCKPVKNQPCDNQPAKAPEIPATADKFPFPAQDPPASSANPEVKPPLPNSFPFPGEPADAPNKEPEAGNPAPATKPKSLPGEPPDSSSSSMAPGPKEEGDPAVDTGSTKAPIKDTGSTGSTRFQRKHLAKVEDLDHRELEDLDVSHYYITTGNFIAAYNRAQDALKLYPDDENAHLAVAVAAEKLKKKDVAAAEYKAYLKLAPDGDQARQATKALQLLSDK